MADTKVWFITGASSGFGRSVTELLLNKGAKVIATLRQLDALSDLSAQFPSQLLVIQLDVTNSAGVTAAFAKAKEVFGRIDVVLNNAGQCVIGEMESVSEEGARQMFEVNFWGAMHVSKEAVKFFREVNNPIGGRLLQVSSRLGLVGGPATAFYSASKFALEGLSESLANELDPAWNIKVTIIEPGPFRTKIFKENQIVAPQHPAYANPGLPGSQVRQFITSDNINGDADKAAVAIEKLSHLDEVPMRLPLHRKVIVSTRDKIKSLTEDVNNFESWSEDLYL
ncbi:NAD(P)-binding protein [Suillus clintonianus]|uniref:NAD(P)-binding protein n=1 Tax=Suillus clintonianus TaxID=1904413 RepID=UPI001B878B53|nr:NAD(P)-binding protein [Suillus clintonianus]KAG2142958.1 NAD(P)-binding protein [Suillus clintonianus]